MMHTKHVGATLCNPIIPIVALSQIAGGAADNSGDCFSFHWEWDATLHLPSSTAGEKVVWNGGAA